MGSDNRLRTLLKSIMEPGTVKHELYFLNLLCRKMPEPAPSKNTETNPGKHQSRAFDGRRTFVQRAFIQD